MIAMRGPGERLRQLLNRNNPENSFEYDEQQVEKATSVDQATPPKFKSIGVTRASSHI